MTMFDQFGNEVKEIRHIATGPVKYNIDEILQHGREPDWPKDELNGKQINVYGIIGPELWSRGPVYFILLKRKEDAEIDDPWGVMFPANSPVCTKTLAAARQSKLPFAGVIQKTTSESNPDFQYWEFRRK